MNNTILEETFYDPKIGLMSFEKFRAKIKELHPEIKTKVIREFYDNQEINQLAKKPISDPTKSYKINGPELTFQIDLMFIPKSIKTKEAKIKKAKEEGLFPKKLFYVFLLCIEILSRKAYIYALPNKQLPNIISAYRQFLDDVKKDTDTVKDTNDYFEQDKPFAIITDDGFDFNDFTTLNEDLNIIVDASTAYNDHITNGNRLGLIDRLVRTVKNLFMKFVYSTSGKTYSVKEVISSIVENYNNTPHRSLDNTTPNEVFFNKEARMKIFNENLAHNNGIDQTMKFNIGDTVRILNRKEAFGKEKPQFSKEIYTISEQTGYKYYVKDDQNNQLKRRFKPTELLKITSETVQNKNPVNTVRVLRSRRKEVRVEQTLKQLGMEQSNIIPETEKRIRKANPKYI